MITEAQIISQPYSGEYDERVYDKSSPWNSQHWTWIKFINSEGYEWCGQFRGVPRGLAISEKLNLMLILTSDYLFELDRESGNVIMLEDRAKYHHVTAAPTGDFILADYYNLERVKQTISQKESIESPVQMDMIELNGWEGNHLRFKCDEFLNWDRHLDMILDIEKWEIRMNNAVATKQN